MGSFAEETAQEYQFTRQAQDEFAIASLQRAQKAQQSGAFDREIVPVEVKGRKGVTTVTFDEQPAKGDLSPRSRRSSPLSRRTARSPPPMRRRSRTAPPPGDDADERRREARPQPGRPRRRACRPRPCPARFTTAPVFAMRKALEKAGWQIGDVDLFEVNEAFACVAMIAMHDLGISHDVLNVHGGACALGHPIGASGARVLATLLSALETNGQKRGLASLCIGGGEATAMAVELLD
jgi:acetyl-CoA C-acetyltransferase